MTKNRTPPTDDVPNDQAETETNDADADARPDDASASADALRAMGFVTFVAPDPSLRGLKEMLALKKQDKERRRKRAGCYRSAAAAQEHQRTLAERLRVVLESGR